MRHILVTLFLFSVLTEHVHAQEITDEPDQPTPSSETHDAIRALRDSLLKAIDDKDVDGLLEYLHEDVVMTAQAGSELKAIRKHQGIRDYMEQLLTGPNPGVKSIGLNIEVEELTILHGEDTGIAFGTSNDHYVLRDGNEFDLATRWSATLVKDEDAWKVANLHLSSNLFDNPVLDGMKKMLYIVGAVAALLGLVIGIGYSKVFKSQKI